jgi:hypothetical protein
MKEISVIQNSVRKKPGEHPALIRPGLPVLNNPKGDGRSKTKNQEPKIKTRVATLRQLDDANPQKSFHLN